MKGNSPKTACLPIGGEITLQAGKPAEAGLKMKEVFVFFLKHPSESGC